MRDEKILLHGKWQLKDLLHHGSVYKLIASEFNMDSQEMDAIFQECDSYDDL